MSENTTAMKVKLWKRKRSMMDLLLEVLECCMEPKNITKILYECNLAGNIYKRLVRYLEQEGLLTIIQRSTDYQILRPHYLVTERGREVVLHWQQIQQLVG